jgi:hypothetical protein
MAFVRASHDIALKLKTIGVDASIDRRNASLELLTRSTYPRAQGSAQ